MIGLALIAMLMFCVWLCDDEECFLWEMYVRREGFWEEVKVIE